MTFIDANRTPKQRAKREAQLEAMRERYRTDPPRSRGRHVTEKIVTEKTRYVPPKVFSPREIAHAIRIAKKMASENREPNPQFIDALECAASYFDDL